ncbi:hypothetical protein RO21_08320 [[Actinobacillus] muris]|uniref:NirD/YgiW/YdeI family stress tolerance protein n=1 Tax=Muribacter muris TaxID=67855 RepID=A0A0J5P3I9_9PAST|nr:NirD/YgiW/YdeI family stress tolerance protein [Muribacter muris]KMK51043.1 hypothetical protein RO21_08320 [[Actinobacillus] muris] [Muribacter muris]MBF0785617.1 YgiW/YdeI family stress tolerance OB fold protein [Muribacter muris]MBF0828033.1 YgiW/YdeI family stress tolerance OB fold protein [Muribacter muris]TFV09109.1 NirD/YgiW/YdeI family stress tolerance protein [Muribacter muris]
MKKVIALAALVGLSSIAVAQGFKDDNNTYHGKPHTQHGFYDDRNAAKSVKDALNAADNSLVIIEGKIVKQVGKDDFIFQDATGEMEIEVSRKAWNGQTITPQDTVEIRGKVDKDWGKTEIEVKQVIKK